MTAPRVDFSGRSPLPISRKLLTLTTAPDLLAMTGTTGDQCGVGEPAFKIEILDESVAEYGGHPPDAPGGVDTFKGIDVGGAAVCAAATGGTSVTLAAGGTSVGGESTAEATPAVSAADTTAVLPTTTAVAAVAPPASAVTSEAASASVATTARGGRGSWSRQ